MSRDTRVKVGIIGSLFQGLCHAESFQQISDAAEIVAIASPTPGNAAKLAKQFNIPRVFTDYKQMIAEKDIELITITAPNALHCQMTIDIANAGKHVLCEKPLCVTLEEADLMIDTCKEKGVLLLYAEELLFTPKYLKVKQMADEGAFGKIYQVKQCEKHFGPHSDWFWDVNRSGGGALLDLGCHGIAFCLWFLGHPKIKSVYAQMGTYVHQDKTKAEDDATCIIEFENDAVGIIENSWARRGGMQDRVEVHGEGGVSYADLHMGNAMPTYSEYGFGYAVEKAPTTKGWTWPVFEEFWNYGFPQEMRHFCQCVRDKEQPITTGELGRTTLQAIYAAYHSAGTGKKVSLPFKPKNIKKPIDLWLTPRNDL